MAEFLQSTYYNNTVSKYLAFLSIAILSIIVIRIAGGLFIKRLTKMAEKTESKSDDALVKDIKKYLLPILYFAAVLLCTKVLYIGSKLQEVIDLVTLAYITIAGAIFLSKTAAFFVSKHFKLKNGADNDNLAVKWISKIVGLIIWIIFLILFLDNSGVEITSIVAGLGIGGLALAFAAQVVLGDIFCFFSIILDKPFEIGDFIISGEEMGTVEHIGIKTTRVRALGGEQIVFPNTNLTSSRIKNYKTMDKRRVLFHLGITYNTKVQTLKKIPGMIKEIVESVDNTVFGRAHFCSYEDSSLNFEIVYYVLSDDYDKYMDIHQQINLKIKEVFDDDGIEFALPAQTLYVNRTDTVSNLEEPVF